MSSPQAEDAAATRQQSDESASQVDEEKQRQIDKKMEEMRRKNELLRRRYEEIEDDKRNANLNSIIAGTKLESEEDDDGDDADEASGDDKPISQRKTKQAASRREHAARSRPAVQEVPIYGKSRGRLVLDQPNEKPGQQNRRNLPPPDPKYNFLSDPVRSGGRGIGSRDFGNVEFRRGPPRPSPGGWIGPGRGRGLMQQRSPEPDEVGHPKDSDYWRWKEERDKIDAERLARQQTSSGHWKREWDTNKDVARYEDAQEPGGRRDYSAQSGGWHKQQQQRGQYDHSGGPARQPQPRNGPRQDRFPPSRDGNRHGYDSGQSMRGNIQQGRREDDDARGGHSFLAKAQQRSANRRGFGSTNEEQSDAAFGKRHETAADHERAGERESRERGKFSRASPPKSDDPGDAWTQRDLPRQQRPTQTENASVKSSLKESASVDIPSSEYASPEPQPQQHRSSPNSNSEEGGTLEDASRKYVEKWPDVADDDYEEEEHWEDVEEGGGNSEAYYDEARRDENVNAAETEAVNVDESINEDEEELKKKLLEMEKRVQQEGPEADVETSNSAQLKSSQARLETSAEAEGKDNATALEDKEAATVARRRQTVESGSEVAADESQDSPHERPRVESMDQIEREMIERMNQNIQAVEAALGHSEEDLQFLLSSGALSSAPVLEGADDEELLADDEPTNGTQTTTPSKQPGTDDHGEGKMEKTATEDSSQNTSKSDSTGDDDKIDSAAEVKSN